MSINIVNIFSISHSPTPFLFFKLLFNFLKFQYFLITDENCNSFRNIFNAPNIENYSSSQNQNHQKFPKVPNYSIFCYSGKYAKLCISPKFTQFQPSTKFLGSTKFSISISLYLVLDFFPYSNIPSSGMGCRNSKTPKVFDFGTEQENATLMENMRVLGCNIIFLRAKKSYFSKINNMIF